MGNVTAITDAKANRLRYDALNRLLGIAYAYDDLDRLMSITHRGNKIVSYGYDLVGNRSRLTYPNDGTGNRHVKLCALQAF